MEASLPLPLAHPSTPTLTRLWVREHVKPEKEREERIRKWPLGMLGQEAPPQGPGAAF